MNKLEKAKSVVKEYYDMAPLGIYDCRNVVDDYVRLPLHSRYGGIDAQALSMRVKSTKKANCRGRK